MTCLLFEKRQITDEMLLVYTLSVNQKFHSHDFAQFLQISVINCNTTGQQKIPKNHHFSGFPLGILTTKKQQFGEHH